jgi:N-acetyl sugar amidotransferase
MRYCTVCVEPDTRPGQQFDENGICAPCRYRAEAPEVDWDARRRELSAVVTWARARRTRGYDCALGVSGGKDSTRLAMFAREAGLNPLLVSCTCPPEMMTDRGARNLSNLIDLVFDCVTVNIAPETYRRLVRIGFEDFGNYCRATEIALYASIPRIAVAYGIKLVCLGENPFVTLGTGSGSEDADASALLSMNTLAGGDITPFITPDTPSKLLNWYKFPQPAELERAGVRMIFLGHYIEDYEDQNNAAFAQALGLEVRSGRDADIAETGCLYDYCALDEDFIFVNQLLKYLKMGSALVSQQTSMQVRHGRMTRDEAVTLTTRYDGRIHPRFIDKFCRFLRISTEHFWAVAERYRNPDIWMRDNAGAWRLRNLVGDTQDRAAAAE